MKIGIFGGSFNPIHKAHVEIVKYVLKTLNLDKIIVIPVGKPSHKGKLANDDVRYKMCELCFKDMDKIEVSDIEIKQKTTCYTIDTLEKIIDIYGEDNEYFEIVGQDCIETLKTWKNYEKILKLSKLVVFKRPEHKDIYEHNNIIYLDTPVFDVSSTDLREKIKRHEKISDYVPKDAIDLIKDLY